MIDERKDPKVEPAKIPEELGNCEIIKIHDDGDLTVNCNGVKHVVTKEGDIFRHVNSYSLLNFKLCNLVVPMLGRKADPELRKKLQDQLLKIEKDEDV